MRFSLLLFLFLSAINVNAQQERFDSVREAIDAFGALEQKELTEVDRVKKMFQEGKASGQLKAIYAVAPEPNEPYATALGGIAKYELAEYRGFNLGAALYFSVDVPYMSGEGETHSSELSSSRELYANVAEGYVNYRYEDFNLRAGRQLLNTPLADSDDIRMIQNSFEAYTLGYTYNNIEFLAGYLSSWSGYDAGLDTNWVKTGEDGVFFGGVSYGQGFEYDLWYYNITGICNAIYADLGIEYHVNNRLFVHVMGQYLYEEELQNSNFAANIYGFLTEVVVDGLGVNVSVNRSKKIANKQSFSAFGGGSLFTSMDTMILDNISYDSDVFAYVLGTTYKYKDISFLYAYGDFLAQESSLGSDIHILEQNMGMGYNVSEAFVIGAIYATQKDFSDDENSWDRVQLMLSYNFK
ncbi:MAG: hypothetical protein JXQ67_03995 [Campylobacterales bacterium]|nr:hypothetical protein [Campylobacterales bacterium]